MELKVLEWNLNLRSDGENIIPDFVGAAIKEQDADIVILTEFVFCENANNFLNKTFPDNDYDYYPKESMYDKNTQVNEDEKEPRVNEILIAWKKSSLNLWENEKKEIYTQDCSKSEDVPNLLIIPLRKGRLKLWVAGVRITMTSQNKVLEGKTNLTEFYIQQAELRYNEMKMVYYHLDKKAGDKARVLIAGDFNNYRRGTPRKEWNFNRITCNRGDYTPYTPNGDSWDGDKKFIPAPEDHFITKNCFMENCKYERDFTKSTKEIYKNGDRLLGIQPPNPDHAMLIGTLKF